MHALVLIGSRNHDGRTAKAANALIAGITEGGGTTEAVYLLEADINMCIQRGQDGFGECLNRGVCALEDGFGPLVEKVRKADLVVFATPVYWGDLSEIIRAFIDRLRRICLHEDGKKGIKGKPAIGICVAGGGGGGSTSSANSLSRVLGHCDFDILDVIPCRKQNLAMKLEVLHVTGRRLATNSIA